MKSLCIIEGENDTHLEVTMNTSMFKDILYTELSSYPRILYCSLSVEKNKPLNCYHRKFDFLSHLLLILHLNEILWLFCNISNIKRHLNNTEITEIRVHIYQILTLRHAYWSCKCVFRRIAFITKMVFVINWKLWVSYKLFWI